MADHYRHDPAPGRHLGLVERLIEHLRYWRDVQQMDIPEADEIARIAVKFINAEAWPKPIPFARCSICTSPLDMPDRPWTRNCGGDCLACMAEADDPECVEAIAAMRAGEAVVKAARDVVQHFGVPCCDHNGMVRRMTALRDALPAISDGE